MTRRASWVCTVGALFALTGCSSAIVVVPEGTDAGDAATGTPEAGAVGSDAEAGPAALTDAEAGPVLDVEDAEAGPDAADACPAAPECATSSPHCGAAESDGGTSLVTCALNASGCLAATTTACGPHQSCESDGGAACVCDNDPTCTKAGTFCTASGELETCTADANGCLVVSAVAAPCGAHQTCNAESDGGAACVCNAAPTCTTTGPTCASGDLETCDVDSDSCLFVSTAAAACPTHEVCGGAAGAASCACNNDPTCTKTGPVCTSGGDLETCSADSNSCLFVSTAAAACPVHEVCSGVAGAAGCACHNDPTCTGTGQICTSSTQIETCSTDSNSCLFVSTAASACTTSVANATADCASNACGQTCDTTFHACGSGGTEQCLSNTSTQSCGSSCTPCTPPANSSPTCSGTVLACGFTCVNGFHECGGNSCLDNTSVNSCGASCTACVPPAHSTATCNGTSCGFTCTAPYVPSGATSGAACVPPTPVLLAPVAGSTMGTRKPVLKWTMPAGFTAAHVDVCKDRACGTIDYSADLTGLATAATTTPTGDLPSGNLFWRVFAKDGGNVESLSSNVWEITLEGTHDAPLSTAWGAVPDFNGDGFGDLILQQGDGTIQLYDGSSGGFTALTVAWAPLTTGGLPTTLTTAGDINGDGFADLAELDWSSLLIHFGGPSGLVGAASQTFAYPSSPNGIETEVTAGGDVNGDGYADLIFATYEGGEAPPVYVYFGGPNGLNVSPAPAIQTFSTGPAGAWGGISTAGDVNGDGYADFIIGDDTVNANQGRAYVYLGGPSGLSATSTILTAPLGSTATSCGTHVFNLGDVNGDGYDDVGMWCAYSADYAQGFLYVFEGSASGITTTSATGIVLDGIIGGRAALGDVNGDGYSDIASGDGVCNPSTGCGTDFGGVYLGSASGLGSAANIALQLPVTSGALATHLNLLQGLGDVNGDGFTDLGIQWEWEDSGGGMHPGFLYFQGATGTTMSTTATQTLAIVTTEGQFE